MFHMFDSVWVISFSVLWHVTEIKIGNKLIKYGISCEEEYKTKFEDKFISKHLKSSKSNNRLNFLTWLKVFSGTRFK